MTSLNSEFDGDRDIGIQGGLSNPTVCSSEITVQNIGTIYNY